MGAVRVGPVVTWLAIALLCAPYDAGASTVADEADTRLPTPREPGQPLRVLLVGNSYSRFNVLHLMLHRVAQSAPDGHPFKVHTVSKGGFTLRRHWRTNETRRRLRFGSYPHVVLQDHSLRPIDRAGEFREYVGRFARAIDSTGARPVLYETWARRSDNYLYRKHPFLTSPRQMHAHVSQAYQAAAGSLGAELAPVGRAVEQAGELLPEISLYRNDGSHPSRAGSYLAACVLWGAIGGGDPQDVTYKPWKLTDLEAAHLRRVAASVLEPARPAADPSPLRALPGAFAW